MSRPAPVPAVHAPDRHARRRGPAARAAARHRSGCEPLEPRRLLSVDVTTYHYDNARDGANTAETTLTPANVNGTTFGKLASFAVDGQVYAQPLVVTGVAVPGRGTHDVVLVATEADDVYAFDAHGNNPAPGYLWRTSLLRAGETTVPASDYGSTDITPQVGITGTPVVDPATGTLYVVGAFKEANGTYQQRLSALALTTGATTLGGPVVIAATAPGTGAGSAGGTVSFDPFRENQRPALTLANGQVYVAWASHADQGPYHGWLMAYAASTLRQDAVYDVNPNGNDDGIWMSGGGIAVDAAGNLYFTTGNGTFDANAGGRDYGMSLEKLGPSLAVEDYFTPANEASLSGNDLDYGCSEVVLLPKQAGADPDQILSAGKWGTLYLNDGDTGHLGGFTAGGPDKALATADVTADVATSNLHNSISYWNGHAYVAGDGLPLEAFTVGGGALGTTPASRSANVYGRRGLNGQGAGPTISSNGTANGIVWAVDNTAFTTGPAVLYAYNADDVGQLLYSSARAANGRDTAGPAVKYADAVVANGDVYVAGAQSVTVYGLLPAAAAKQLTGPLIGTTGSYQSDGNTAAKATDGNVSTFFDAPAANGDWVGYDLRAADAVTSVRFAPRAGWAARMVGGVFQGSNSPQFTAGVTTLYTVTATPAAGTLTTVAVGGGTAAYRYVRYLSPAGSYGDVAEVQFFGAAGPAAATATQLAGATVGTAGSYQDDGNTAARATDGNPSTFFDGPTANGNVVGLDLGTQQVVDQIAFAPRGGWATRMVGGVFQASATADFTAGVTTLYTVTATPPTGSLTTVSVTPTLARYVRYRSPAGSYGDVAEVRFLE